MTHSLKTRSVNFHEARGTLPAWIWKALREAERSSGGGIPVAVLREGQSSFVVVDARDWNEVIRLDSDRGAA